MQDIQKNKEENGFTMIEIIIAIFILTISIIGIYSAFSAVTILAEDSTNKLTATYLSQEGMEIIRNIRDMNWVSCPETTCSFAAYLTTSNSDTRPDAQVDCTNGCQVDYRTSPYGSAGGGLAPVAWPSGALQSGCGGAGTCLSLDSNGFYSYLTTGSKLTSFKRKITITPLNNIAIKVVSEVFWEEKPNIINIHTTFPEVKTEEVLYDWK